LNILYLNHYAGAPSYGMEFRPYYLAREWVRMGHRVRMLAASYSHVRAVQPRARQGDERQSRWSEQLDGIEYVWMRVPRYEGNNVGRVWNITVFLTRIALATRRLVEEMRPDVVIASSTYPMDIWVAKRLARIARAQLIFEVHDLWPLSPIELGDMSPRHPFVRLCAFAERTAYRDADAIVSMLPNVHDHVASFGVPLSRLHVVPNGVSPADWEEPAESLRSDIAEFINAEHAAGRLVVCYAGAHGLPNALDVLLEAAERLRDAPLSFVLVGDGLEKSRLVAQANAASNDRVRLFASIPKAQVPTLLANIDIAYIGLRRSPLFRFGIAPNKLLDYMMAGCTVLQAIEAGNDPVSEAGCGLTVEAGSPVAVAEGLRRLAAMSPLQRREMGLRGRQYVRAHHTYPVLASRFLTAFETKVDAA
jgi:glycosyltransferase involved in cell wall biosynthesis